MALTQLLTVVIVVEINKTLFCHPWLGSWC